MVVQFKQFKHPAITDILPEHVNDYFVQKQGFSVDEVARLQAYGVRSISKSKALELGIKKWDADAHEHKTDGGIWFPFTQRYGQLRFNRPIRLSNGEEFKYLGPLGASPKAWKPHGWQAITEGFCDAAKPTLLGVPTAAIAGVDNVIYSVPRGCKKPIIFDSDGWSNGNVIRALIVAAIWTEGKINLFPRMERYPHGGACEFFKSGGSIVEYKGLIDEALAPRDFLKAWGNKWDELGIDEETRQRFSGIGIQATERLAGANDFIRKLESKVAEKKQVAA